MIGTFTTNGVVDEETQTNDLEIVREVLNPNILVGSANGSDNVILGGAMGRIMSARLVPRLAKPHRGKFLRFPARLRQFAVRFLVEV